MSTIVAKKSGSIESTEGLPIRYDVYHPADSIAGDFPVILFLHGFKGFKDWGTFPTICEQLSRQGFTVVAMNFSLNGIGEDPMEFDRLDLFARETLSQDLDDVGSVLQAIGQNEITVGGHSLDSTKVGILGHSRGGQTAVAAAAEYSKIKCLVTWSAVADYNARWSEEMKRDWENKGVTEIENGRTGQIMPMKRVIYDDARNNAERVIALNRVRELQLPALFIHSTGDEAVSQKNAKQLYGACPSSTKELVLLENTGHTFGGTHPFNADDFPAPLQEAFNKSSNWFKNYLK